MDLSSPVSAPSGFIREPPLSPGAPRPMSSTERPPSAPPPAGGGPSLEAQVVRLGLMTPDDVATTMREEAETGRTFAELAVESGRLKAEDLAKLTGEKPAPAPSPVSLVPDSEPEAVAEAEPDPDPEADPLDEPVAAIAPEPEPEPETTQHHEDASRASAEVFVCLTSGERIAAGSFDDPSSAEDRARELMTTLDDDGEWPRLNGRFIRPDAVVSIDVELDER